MAATLRCEGEGEVILRRSMIRIRVIDRDGDKGNVDESFGYGRVLLKRKSTIVLIKNLHMIPP